MSEKSKSVWKRVIDFVITVLTALGTVLATSCINPSF